MNNAAAGVGGGTSGSTSTQFPQQITLTAITSVAVPSTFMGMGGMEYPDTRYHANPPAVAVTKAQINVGVSRQLQPSFYWSNIETSQGVYNWTYVDQIITYNRQQGIQNYFNVCTTPTFYENNVDNNPSTPDAQVAGNAGYPALAAKNTSGVNGLIGLANFVSALVNRYNVAGGAWYNANFATLGKGLWGIEIWNEPAYSAADGSNAAGNTGGSPFWMTCAQYVDYAYTVYNTAFALDNTLVITCAGFSTNNPTGKMNLFMTTNGVINTTKNGTNSCNALAFHPYSLNPPGVSTNGSWNQGDIITGQPPGGNVGALTMKNFISSKGWGLPLYASECSTDPGFGSATAQAFYLAPASVRYKWYCRWFMAQAACGVQMVSVWMWLISAKYPTGTGTYPNLAYAGGGDWQLDTLGVQKAYNDCAAKLPGKTITAAAYIPGGEVTLAFNDGTSWTV